MTENTLLDFLSKNWGNLASVLGAGLTVYFSWAAGHAAMAAKAASDSARLRIAAIDWVIHYGEMVTQVDDISSRLGQKVDLLNVSKDCTKLRSLVAVCLGPQSLISETDLRRRFSTSSTKLASIANQLDLHIEGKIDQLDTSAMRKTLATERELYSIALTTAKKHAVGS